MLIRQIFDEKLAQYAYLIGCQAAGEAILIDPKRHIDRYVEIAKKEKLKIVAVADTHLHADYVSGMREFGERYNVKLYVSDEGEEEAKCKWVKDGKYDYELLKHGDTFNIGNIEFKTLFTPGHTPEHLSFLIYDRASGADEPVGIITGDFVFVGDVGRPDLLESAAGIKGVMEPSARTLYKSLQLFKELPEFLQVWPAHGAGSACGKALGSVPQSTVGYELRYNASIKMAEDEEKFVDYILEGQPEPPMYFAQMKKWNILGPPFLGGLPEVKKIGLSDLKELSGRNDVAIVDTRSKDEFMEGHIPGSLLITIAKAFPTKAGSFIEENTPIYLIIEESRLKEAVIDLISVGLDNIKGYATPDVIKEYEEEAGSLSKIERIKFDDLKNHDLIKDGMVLDVRKGSEYDESHIPGAKNISHTRLFVRKDEVPKDSVIFTYCAVGGRAAASSALLSKYGYKVVFIDDSFEEWEKAGGQVVK